MIRVFDMVFALLGLLVSAPVMLVLLILGYRDTGSPIFAQTRVGRHQQPFVLYKLRTMHVHTESVATHLAHANSITDFGRFLRRTKLDELPQLWNVLKGDMSLVGPRPCLFNQTELIDARQQRGVFAVRPGITGLAQINDIDMSDPEKLAITDQKMIENYSVICYYKLIILTLAGKGSGDRVRT